LQLKEKIYAYCHQIIDKKIEDIRSAYENATESANNETKSTAGDKHETARAMMQLEQEKLGNQLKELREQKAELEKTDITKTPVQIAKGTLIQSDKGLLFLSIGLGKIIIDGKMVVAISPQSPLGQKLIGKKKSESTEINGVTYNIQDLF
jgi:hypothetical protein